MSSNILLTAIILMLIPHSHYDSLFHSHDYLFWQSKDSMDGNMAPFVSAFGISLLSSSKAFPITNQFPAAPPALGGEDIQALPKRESLLLCRSIRPCTYSLTLGYIMSCLVVVSLIWTYLSYLPC